MRNVTSSASGLPPSVFADSGHPQAALRRLPEPLITPQSAPSIGDNINGPSLLRMPEWAHERLGRYHLYFAHHKGDHIRLAWADQIEGPWQVHPPGALHLNDSHFLTEAPPLSDDELAVWTGQYEAALGYAAPADIRGDLTAPHVASPDVHIDHAQQRFVMYFHGLAAVGRQTTRRATSTDGVTFTADAPEICTDTYFRAFQVRDEWFALAMPGRLYRQDPTGNWEPGPQLFIPEFRHCAVQVSSGPELTVHVWWTRVGDQPERIFRTELDVAGAWTTWSRGNTEEALRPEMAWEGADLPADPSRRGDAPGLVHQLRDPCIVTDEDRTWLLYSIAGESGIAAAELID